MRLYVVEGCVSYEGRRLIGVCDTPKRAYNKGLELRGKPQYTGFMVTAFMPNEKELMKWEYTLSGEYIGSPGYTPEARRLYKEGLYNYRWGHRELRYLYLQKKERE